MTGRGRGRERGLSRVRGLLIAIVVGAPALGAAVACTAGDEIAYQSAGVTGEGGIDGADDTGRIVGDSTIDVAPVERSDDGGTLPPPAAIGCNDGFDAGCDPSAGLGCCLVAGSDATGNGNMCFEQAQVFGGTQCRGTGDIFLACLTSDSDNTCCWQSDGNSKNTRYRSTCDGGVEACDPTADGGGVCTTGGPCTTATCRGVVVGYCGASSPCP